jgi:hypothetical protein
MKVVWAARARCALAAAPASVRKLSTNNRSCFAVNRRHPSLYAKKFDETEGIWQARVNLGWHFYFKIRGDVALVTSVVPHPK